MHFPCLSNGDNDCVAIMGGSVISGVIIPLNCLNGAPTKPSTSEEWERFVRARDWQDFVLSCNICLAELFLLKVLFVFLRLPLLYVSCN